jgi:serine O-acetyltransferase
LKYDRNTVKTWAGDSQWRALQADYQRFRLLGHSGWASEAFWGLAIYRMQRTIAKARAPGLWAPAAVFLAVLHKLLGIFTGIDLHPEAEIGAGLFIAHGSQVTVIKGARLGVDCTLAQVCTIGAGVTPGVPNIGDHVYISSNSCVLGPVTVGEGATIAGNSLVISDVPARHTAIGVPARILPLFKDQRFRKDNISALNLKAVPEVAPPTPMLD